MKDNNIITELNEISSAVANINRGNVFSVPPGYFIEFPGRILQIVLHTKLSELVKDNIPYKVPEGYFSGLPAQILDKLKMENFNDVEAELTEVAPLLNTISKKPPFTIPVGYFEQLTIAPTQKGKVVPINRPKQFIKYLAAASVAGIMALGGYLYLNDKPAEQVATTTFSEKTFTTLSDEEIMEYLNNNPSATDVSLTNTQVENEFEKYTRELSEEEIDSYLQENNDAQETADQEG